MVRRSSKARKRARLAKKLLRLRRRPWSKPRTYARFYGRYKNNKGRIKGFSLQVKTDNLGPKETYDAIKRTIGRILYKKMLPVHVKGQTFQSFEALFDSQWVRIRGVLDYRVKMKYGIRSRL